MSIRRSFHVDAQKIIESRGALRNGKNQAFAKFNVDIEAELRELTGNVGVQPFLGDAFENLKISIARMLRVRRGGDIFAKIIEAGEHPRVITLAGGGDGFVERLARDESPRHA